MAEPPSLELLNNARDHYKGLIEDEWEARFLILTDAWIEQTGLLGVCNVQIRLLREWENERLNLENMYGSGRESSTTR